ncbi:MAG: PAS domain S-box protein [Leptolyngbyaceae cyanobacterium RU_5_1]|nr:PAS domain S-box protein [Leptolyngbyaceae cyanobacterium RU_5_1]
MKGLSERAIAGGFVLALLLLSGVGVVSYPSLHRLIEHQRRVDYTHQVLEAIDDTLLGMTDAAYGRRGYLLSQEKRFLTIYQDGVQLTNKNLQAIRRLTADDATQQRRLDELEPLVAERLAGLQRSLDLYYRNPSDRDTQSTLTSQGTTIQEKLQEKLRVMHDDEQVLLQQRSVSAEGSVAQVTIVEGSGLGLSFVLLAAVYGLLQRQVRIRQRAEAALQNANEQLETKVQVRTAELVQVNTLLQTELLEREFAEKARSQSEKFLRTITDALPVLVSYVDADLCYRFHNRAYEIWFGKSCTEMDRQLLWQVLGKPAFQAIEPYVRAVLSGREVTFKVLVPYRDGGARWVNAVYIPDFGEQGEARGFVALVSDITERKQAEEQLRQSEKHLRAVLQTMPVMMDAFDPDWNIIVWNQECERVTGYRADQVVGNPEILELLYPNPAYRQQMIAAWNDRGNSYRDWEWDITCKDGSIKTISWSNISEQFPISGWAAWGIGVDITGRKQVERILRQINEELEIKVQARTAELNQLNQELVRSNQELEQFAYITSHDLQEPLRAVIGYTQLLVQDYQDQLDPAAQEYTAYIVDGARRMQQLIQDLLTYSRVGTRDLVLGCIDCNAVLRQALGNLQVAIAESNATIHAEPLPIAIADQTQFVQLFQNLIGNALKFRRQEPPQIRISAILNGREWCFQVQDNGIGIKPRYLERIFEIFKRLHPRTEFPGTGIGLAICKKIIDRHNGQIWAESEPGVGTTFYFTLPHHEQSDTETD